MQLRQFEDLKVNKIEVNFKSNVDVLVNLKYYETLWKHILIALQLLSNYDSAWNKLRVIYTAGSLRHLPTAFRLHATMNSEIASH